MATKQEKAVQRAVTREHNKGKVREEKHVLWFLLAIIALLLWLLLAQRFGWWPYSQPTLGSAFYTNISDNAPVPDEANSVSDSTGGSDGNDGSNGSNGGSGGGGTTTPPSGSSDSLLDFAANVNVGTSKATLSGQANGLGESCAVVVGANAPNAGKQEVCTYTEGDDIVTVTYLNDRVISASKSGF
jgi:hypothetical protein